MLPVAALNRFAAKNHLFTQQSKILAAVSGGIDSVFMVHLLHAAGYQIAVAHCNFQLRGGESIRDQDFCRQLAKKLDVPFYTIAFDTEAYAAQNKLSIQMAARELRYNWFEQLRQQTGYDVIALAHHQNDTIETILLNLTRGTGIAGLHGIKPKNGNLIRPLLFLSRQEIEDTVTRNEIVYVEDSSNTSVKYGRNKIRQQIIPVLKGLNPNLEQTFQNHLQHFNELENLLEMQVAELKSKILNFRKDEISLAISEVKKLQPIHLLLAGLLMPYGFNTTTVNDLISSLDKHAGRKFESATHSLIVDREVLIIKPVKPEKTSIAYVNTAEDLVTFGKFKFTSRAAGPGFDLNDNPNIAALDAGLLSYPLTIRNWQRGDQFYPLGMKTRKKLSDFFIGLKIPVGRKDTIPILVNGNGDIIWVGAYRIDDRYKITPATKKISIFEVTEI